MSTSEEDHSVDKQVRRKLTPKKELLLAAISSRYTLGYPVHCGYSDRLHLSRYSSSLLGCYQADSISNMAASSNAEQTQLQDMEEEDAGMEEREMESDEDEEGGMGVENSDDEEGDSSEDEKENEAEIQRLEEQVISQQSSQAWLTNVSQRANENEWMVNTVSYNKSAALKPRAALSCYGLIETDILKICVVIDTIK